MPPTITSCLAKCNLEVLKEPRGFIRCIQWFFSLITFATMADFMLGLSSDIAQFNQGMQQVSKAITISASASESDANFVVFMGVVSWLYCFVRYVSGDIDF